MTVKEVPGQKKSEALMGPQQKDMFVIYRDTGIPWYSVITGFYNMEVDWGSQLFFYDYEGTRLMSIEPTEPTENPETGMHIDPCGVSKHGPT